MVSYGEGEGKGNPELLSTRGPRAVLSTLTWTSPDHCQQTAEGEAPSLCEGEPGACLSATFRS